MIVGDTRDAGGMWQLGYSLLQDHEELLSQYPMSEETQQYFANLATQSLQQQQQLEQDNSVSFSDYLAAYR